ncbi:hypothetical protein YB2330_002430 [Saitoella coloradoensis]
MSMPQPTTPPVAATAAGQHVYRREDFIPLQDLSANSPSVSYAPSTRELTPGVEFTSSTEARLDARRMGTSDTAVENENRPQPKRMQSGDTLNKAGQSFHRRGHSRSSSLGEPQPDRITKMGQFYDKLYGYSVITRYLLMVLPLAILLAIPIIIGATVAQGAKIGGVRIVWFFIWLEVVWVSPFVTKLVAQLLPRLLYIVIGVVSVSTRKYAMIIDALQVPLTILGWFFTSYITFLPIMTRNPDQRAANDTTTKKWESTIARILAALTLGALLFLAEKVMIQLIAVNFTKVSYEDRIRENKWSLKMLANLYECSRRLYPTYTMEAEAEDAMLAYADRSGRSSRMSLFHANPKADAKKLQKNVKRVVDKTTSAFGNVASEITGKQVFKPDSPYSVVVDAMASSKKASTLARRLFWSFIPDGEDRDELILDDLVRIMGPNKREDAEKAFGLFDKDGNGDLSMDEMIMAVQEIQRERDALSRSIKDVSSAVRRLDDLLLVVVGFIDVFIIVAMLSTSLSTLITTYATTFLGMTWAFSGTWTELLNAIIFLFNKHPFDVGDRVVILDQKYIVVEMALLYTRFKRADGMIVQCPNSVLGTLWVNNVRRSGAMFESLTLSVSFATTIEEINELQYEMIQFLKANKRDFYEDLSIEINDIPKLGSMDLTLSIKHKSNWQNDALRAQRRNKFMCALVLAVRKVELYAPGAAAPVPALGESENPMFIIKETRAPKKNDETEEKSNNPFLSPAPGATNLARRETLAKNKKDEAALQFSQVLAPTSPLNTGAPRLDITLGRRPYEQHDNQSFERASSDDENVMDDSFAADVEQMYSSGGKGSAQEEKTGLLRRQVRDNDDESDSDAEKSGRQRRERRNTRDLEEGRPF